MTIHKCWFAVLEYRPDPASNEGRIPLAVVMEVRRGKKWMLGFKTKASLTVTERERLDQIGDELLKEPAQFVKSAIESVLRKARGGEALSKLADEYQWSFTATPPQKRELRGWTKSALQQLTDELHRLYAEHVIGVPATRSRPEMRRQETAPAFVPPSVTVPFHEIAA